MLLRKFQRVCDCAKDFCHLCLWIRGCVNGAGHKARRELGSLQQHIHSFQFHLFLSPFAPAAKQGADTVLGGRVTVGLLTMVVDLCLFGGTSAAWEAGEPEEQLGPVRDGACCSFPGSWFVSLSSPEKLAGVSFLLLFPPRASMRHELQFANLSALYQERSGTS